MGPLPLYRESSSSTGATRFPRPSSCRPGSPSTARRWSIPPSRRTTRSPSTACCTRTCRPGPHGAARALRSAASVLESRTGQPPLGWSAPSWGLSAETFDVLVSLGLVYDASLMEFDRPHRVRCADAELIELPISTVLDDWALFGASLDAGSTFAAPAHHALEIWGEEFDGLRSVSGYFNSTFHPHLSGRPGRLKMLEQLFRHMRTFDDVWFRHVRAGGNAREGELGRSRRRPCRKPLISRPWSTFWRRPGARPTPSPRGIEIRTAPPRTPGNGMHGVMSIVTRVPTPTAGRSSCGTTPG